MPRKKEDCTDEPDRAKGQDDRHLPHPHGIAVDPAGGAVLDASVDTTADDLRCAEEPRTAASASDAIGFVVLEGCADPSEDDSFAGTDGVGSVVIDDCDGSSGRQAGAGNRPPSGPGTASVGTAAATVTAAGAGLGFAVLPDGRVSGGAGTEAETREGYGLVFPR